MPSIFRIVPVLIITALLAACSTTAFHVGNDFDVNLFSTRVERGVSTQNQIRTWLGAPTSTGIRVEADGERFDEWTYYFAAGNMTDLSRTRLKTLQIKFDRQGIVQGYNWSASAD